MTPFPPLTEGAYAFYRSLKYVDPTVAHILRSGGSAEDCVIELVKQNQKLREQVVRLGMIAPRKIRLPDGQLFLWQCPPELIPEVTL